MHGVVVNDYVFFFWMTNLICESNVRESKYGEKTYINSAFLICFFGALAFEFLPKPYLNKILNLLSTIYSLCIFEVS